MGPTGSSGGRGCQGSASTRVVQPQGSRPLSSARVSPPPCPSLSLVESSVEASHSCPRE